MIPCLLYHPHRLDQHLQRKDTFPLKASEGVALSTAQERNEALVQEEGLAADPEVAPGAQREQRPHHESPARDCKEEREEDRVEDIADVHPAHEFHPQDQFPQAHQRPQLRTAKTRTQSPPTKDTGFVETDSSDTNVPLAVSGTVFA